MPLWNDFRSAHAFVPLCFSFHLFSANKSKSLLLLFYREKRLPLRLLSLQTEEKAAFCVQQSQSLCVDVFPKKWNPDNIFAFAKRSTDKHRFANIAEKCSFFRGKWSVERGKSTCTVHNALRRKLYPINENRLPNRKYITIQFWICLAADVQVHKSTACEFVCVGVWQRRLQIVFIHSTLRRTFLYLIPSLFICLPFARGFLFLCLNRCSNTFYAQIESK